MTIPTDTQRRTEQPTMTRRPWARFLVGFAIVWGVLAGLGEIDATGRWGIAILVLVAATAVVVEMFLFKTPLRQAVGSLGLGRPGGRSLALAAVVSGLVLLVYPAMVALTGAQLRLVPNWPWILVGIFAFHGLAEEIVHDDISQGHVQRSERHAAQHDKPIIHFFHQAVGKIGFVN